jgi:hypothetical protein
MKRQQTHPSKRTAFIAALLFLALSLLFPGCDIPAFQKILCDNCQEISTPGTHTFQYLDCNEEIKSIRITVSGSPIGVARIEDCLRIIRDSPVSTGN